MKKETFIWTECLVFVIFILWLIFTLSLFKVLDVNMNWLTSNLGNKSDAASNLQISVISGATVIQNAGSLILVLGVMVAIVYAAISIVLYYNKVNKNALYCCNVVFYGLAALSLLIGILFLVVNF